MSNLIPFGPAIIKHDSTDIGKTYNGGSINLLKHVSEPISTTYTIKERLYGVQGEIRLFSFDTSLTITDTTLYSYGEIEIILQKGKITLHRAKILIPDSISFGTNSQQAFTLRLTGGKDTDDKIITFN